MKVIATLFLSIYFAWASVAVADSPRNEWHWINATSLPDDWHVDTGLATVVMADGKIEAKLRDPQGEKEILFEFIGTLRLDKMDSEEKDVQSGVVVVTVKRLYSDADPTQYSGTYKKIIYPKEMRKALGEYKEVIIITSGFNMIGLTR